MRLLTEVKPEIDIKEEHTVVLTTEELIVIAGVFGSLTQSTYKSFMAGSWSISDVIGYLDLEADFPHKLFNDADIVLQKVGVLK